MPHHIQFLEDLANEDRFSVENAVKNFKGNFLIIHGSEDEAVPFSAENLHFGQKLRINSGGKRQSYFLCQRTLVRF